MGYTFRLASLADKDAIIAFLATHWAKNHIFVKSEELFLWQYQEPGTDRLNFMLAVDKATGAIDSLMGFIPTSRFDPALEPDRNLWGAIWKTVEGKGIVGLYVLTKLQQMLDASSYSGISISEESQKIYAHLKYEMGDMEHYYIAAPGADRKLITTPVPALPPQAHPDACLVEITKDELSSLRIDHPGPPRKSVTYLYNRYALHPIYNYTFHKVLDGDCAVAVLVSRLIHVDQLNAACLRIVDWLGDWRHPLDYRKGLLDIAGATRSEYVDLVCMVNSPGHFKKHGFHLKNPGNEVVPNYFEPFVPKNIHLKYVYHGKHDSFHFFRGDADQDRPNLLR